jgi:cell division protein FtsQ
VLRINVNYIKTFLLLLLVGFLYAFSAHQNKQRPINKVTISFEGDENLYISRKAVNKMLIQNGKELTKVTKDILDLNALESALNSNKMIKSAEVYLTVNGEVKVDIKQKRPIARVSTNASYYIDEQGLQMPLSSNYAARVPLVTGAVQNDKLQTVFKVANAIDKDDFLKKYIVEIHQKQDQSITLKTRVHDFDINLGHLNDLDRKIKNFKAFYQKAKKDEALNNYSSVNLKFSNQVVCTKK